MGYRCWRLHRPRGDVHDVKERNSRRYSADQWLLAAHIRSGNMTLRHGLTSIDDATMIRTTHVHHSVLGGRRRRGIPPSALAMTNVLEGEEQGHVIAQTQAIGHADR